MRLLITGVHGFVGSNLVDYLSPKHVIYGVDIVSPQKKGVIQTFSWSDLDQNIVPEVDAIIHLAGKAHDTKNKSAADVYFKVNRDLTIKMFDYFCNHAIIQKFIFFSTAKAAADKVDGILTEDVVPSPVGPYGESKIAAERYIIEHAEKLNKDNKCYYIFRPCMIHGPGNKGNLNLLYNVVKKRIPWPLGAYDNLRTFTSIRNVCYVVEGVLQALVNSGIYNLGDDTPISSNELIEEICVSLGIKARIWCLPKGMMNALAAFGGCLHLPLNPERLRKLTESYVSSNNKIKTALGVDTMPVSALEGLRFTLESFSKS